jgi:hypothetical protein
MKKLTIKQYGKEESEIKEEGFQGQLAKTSTDKLLIIALKYPVQGGYSMDDIMTRVKLQRVIEAAAKEEKEEIDFEDADAKDIKAVEASARWGVFHEDLLDFLEEVKKL